MLQATLNTLTQFSLEIIIVGCLFFFLEKLKPADKSQPFIKQDSKQELALAFLNVLVSIPLFSALVFYIHQHTLSYVLPYQAFNEPIHALPLGIQMFLGAFILDFSTYWRHRFTHHYMWRYHSIHHSAEQINWLTSMRLHPLDIAIAVTFDLTILHILGFNGSGMLASLLLVRTFNYFTHMNLNLVFNKPARYIFASPYFHRWHHANEKSAYNKNYCGMFSCIDLMFGTFHHPETGLPESYGIGEKAQKKYPKTLIGQLLYPFQKFRKS